MRMAFSRCSGAGPSAGPRAGPSAGPRAGPSAGPRAARVQENILATRDLLAEAVRNLDGLPPAVTPHQRADGSAGNRQTGEGLDRTTTEPWDRGNVFPRPSACTRDAGLQRPTPISTSPLLRQTELTNWSRSVASNFTGIVDRRPMVGYRPFNPMSVGVKRSQMQHMQRTKKKKIAVWEKEFICLATVGQTHAPTPIEKAELYRAGLGMKLLMLLQYADAWEFHEEILKKFPKLADGGGYELLRTCANSRELTVIPAPSGGYTTSYVKSIVNQAKVYIRPLQKDLSLEEEIVSAEEPVSTVSMHININIELQKHTYKLQVHFNDHDSGAHYLVHD